MPPRTHENMTTGSCSHDARKYVIIEELRRAGTFDAILRPPGPASAPPPSVLHRVHQTKCKPGEDGADQSVWARIGPRKDAQIAEYIAK